MEAPLDDAGEAGEQRLVIRVEGRGGFPGRGKEEPGQPISGLHAPCVELVEDAVDGYRRRSRRSGRRRVGNRLGSIPVSTVEYEVPAETSRHPRTTQGMTSMNQPQSLVASEPTAISLPRGSSQEVFWICRSLSDFSGGSSRGRSQHHPRSPVPGCSAGRAHL